MISIVRNAAASVYRYLRVSRSKASSDLEASESNAEAVSDWWERHHTDQSILWISGSRPKRVWSRLEVTDLIRHGMRVLDIGVGSGGASKALHKAGCVVDALDISKAALERVKPFTQARYTSDSLAGLPSDTYDLAISYLVAQHMSREAMRDQLQHVIRALKREGILAIQTAFSTDGKVLVDSTYAQKAGGVTYNASEFADLVGECSGKIKWQKEIGRFPEWESGWMAYHVGK